MRKGIRHEIEARLYKYAACQEENKTWQETIAAELNKLQPQQLQLFELRYKERKSEREICRKLHIERSTYYSWISDIVQDVAILAAYHKLIKPE